MNKPIMNDKLTKSPQNGASSSAGGGLAKKPGGKVGLPPLLARAQAAQKQEQQNQVDLASMPNRLALLRKYGFGRRHIAAESFQN